MRKEGELPILIAHGGGNGEFPDNTLEAFYNAFSVDIRVMMEADVTYPEGVNPLDNEVFLATTLEELMVAFPENRINAEIKPSGINLANKSRIRSAHRHNIAVHYWTVNDTEEMKHLIDIGADGIMTDYPHRLKEVYDSYK